MQTAQLLNTVSNCFNQIKNTSRQLYPIVITILISETNDKNIKIQIIMVFLKANEFTFYTWNEE